jgi:hypothetical protein
MNIISNILFQHCIELRNMLTLIFFHLTGIFMINISISIIWIVEIYYNKTNNHKKYDNY